MFSVRARWSPPHLHAQVFTSAAGLRTGLYALGAALAGPALTTGARRRPRSPPERPPPQSQPA
jgi:hypothetical protein